MTTGKFHDDDIGMSEHDRVVQSGDRKRVSRGKDKDKIDDSKGNPSLPGPSPTKKHKK